MNIALMTQVQGVSGVTSETGNGAQSNFLDLLSAMLGATNSLGSEETGLMDALIGDETLDLDGLSAQLETWLQQPDSLQWLKSLPQDAYRTFMDAYVGLLAQIESDVSTDTGEMTFDALESTLIQPNRALGLDSLTNQTGRQAAVTVNELKVEQHVQTIRQIVTKYSGTFDQSTKHNPFQSTTVVEATLKQDPEKGMSNWMAKGFGWSKPQIDADTVMYASKGSLPENLQARIEAALQKAPFKSGADGSKVFTVRLYPEQLGELVVKLERHNGELVVKLFASSQDAKQLLQSQMQQLQQTLQPLSQHVRVEVNMTQQAVDVKSTTYEGTEHSDSEQAQEQAKGDPEDDDHSNEDE